MFSMEVKYRQFMFSSEMKKHSYVNYCLVSSLLESVRMLRLPSCSAMQSYACVCEFSAIINGITMIGDAKNTSNFKMSWFLSMFLKLFSTYCCVFSWNSSIFFRV